MLVEAHGWKYYQIFYLAQALISLMPSPMCSTWHIYLLLKNFYGWWYDLWFYRIFKGSEDTYIYGFVVSSSPYSNVMLVFLLYLCCEQCTIYTSWVTHMMYPWRKVVCLFHLLGPAPIGTGTITWDPTFGSFILLEPVLHSVNQFLWWKCLDCLDWKELFWCSECGHGR